MLKKVLMVFGCLSLVLCMAVSFATSSSTGAAGFVDTINTGLSMDAIWNAISPIAPLIITLTLIAVTRYVINRNLQKTRGGKAGRV